MNHQSDQSGIYRRVLHVRMPPALKRRLFEFCDEAGSDKDAEVAAALRKFVSRVSPAPPRLLESMGCTLPMEVADGLRDLCELNGWDPDWVIECAVRQHVVRAPPKRTGGEPRDETRRRRGRRSGP